jgi:hypothetical protein
VLSALIVLPLLAQPWIRRREIIWIISSGTFGLAMWLSTFHSYIIHATHLPWFVFMAIMVSLGMLPALKIFDWVRTRIMPIALIAMGVVFIGAEVVFHSALRKGNQALYDNLIGGSGRWGWFFPALVVCLLLGWVKLATPEHKTLIYITTALVLGSLIAKMVDGGQFGHPTLGRTGWSDSLNRMWLQSFAIFLVTALVGLVQNNKLWGAEEKQRLSK